MADAATSARAPTLATYVIIPLPEVVAGMRPITVAARVTPALALRLYAHAGMVEQAPAYGSVTVRAVRRPGQALEPWGTVQVAGHVYAFSGRVEGRPGGWRVTDFDVLVLARAHRSRSAVRLAATLKRGVGHISSVRQLHDGTSMPSAATVVVIVGEGRVHVGAGGSGGRWPRRWRPGGWRGWSSGSVCT